MKKHILLGAILVILAGVLCLGVPADVFAAKGVIKNPSTGGMSGIIVSDLGITNVGTLPTSKWYFLKEWGRGISRIFTFSATAKTELELKIVNEKAAEALMVQETKPDDESALETALKNYITAKERLQAHFMEMKETSENPNIEKLLKKFDEQISKHTILLNQIMERKLALESELAEFAINEPGVPNKKAETDFSDGKRVFPETNNRVFPETNNRTVCDDRVAPACPRGEIIECRDGKWICIGPATGSNREESSKAY